MAERVVETQPVEAIESGLVDLSGFSFHDVVKAGDAKLDDSAFGHALRRILGDSEDPVAEFNSAHVGRVR